jgi:hypothetical protein
MAESRAMARSLRWALNISMVSGEELSEIAQENAPITSQQLQLVKLLLGRKKISLEEILNLATRKVEQLEQLTVGEGTKLIQWLNKK